MAGTTVRGTQQTVRQNQSSFGIGVEDLYRDTIAVRQNVTEFEGMAANQIFQHSTGTTAPAVEALTYRQRQGTTDHGGSAHILILSAACYRSF